MSISRAKKQESLVAHYITGTNNIIPICILTFLLLLSCAIVPTVVTSIISLSVFFLFMLYVSILYPFFVLKYVLIIFAIISNFAGVVICEFTTIYLNELASSTAYYGSLPLLVLSRWIILPVFLGLDRKWDFNGSTTPLSEKRFLGFPLLAVLRLITCIVLVFTAILLFDALRHPSAMASNLDRFAWRSLYSTSLLPTFIASNMLYLMVFPALSYKHNMKLLGAATLTVYILYLLWTGSKFGNFFMLFCLMLWVFYDRLVLLDTRILQRILIGAITAVIVLVVGAVVIQQFISTANKTGLEYLNQRVAQQGQLWWKTYGITGGAAHPEEFINEITALGRDMSTQSNNIGANYGMYKIMYLTTPADRVNAKLLTGSNYTEAGYAIMYYYFGAFGPPLFSVIAGLLIGLFINWLVAAINGGWLIDDVLLLRLVIVSNATLGAFRNFVFDSQSIISYAYLIIALALRYKMENDNWYKDKYDNQPTSHTIVNIGKGNSG